ncbi:heterokaryon incompatibility protein-domain-containing protein [Xylariaceae sp. FL0016]|nr:heterokaryon incompatibility protein-domain-containing protein [Xylariaceae sp. FL0016]
MASCTICNNEFPPRKTSIALSEVKKQATTCGICRVVYDGITSSVQDSNLLRDDDTIVLDGRHNLLDVKKKDESHHVAEFFTVPGTLRSEPPPEFDDLHYSLPVPVDPLSEQCSKKLIQWIDDCNEKHSECQSGSSPPLPTRVINVGTDDGSTKPFLHISNGETGRYVALSHCWGTSGPPLKTTKANISSRTNGIEWIDFPKSFQDAITITRLLRITYLWIDSLCILQGDVGDWTIASSQMAAVYQNAHLVLSATSAAGSHVGFLSPRPTHHEFRVEPQREGDLPYTLIARPAILHTDFLGPAFQEDDQRRPYLPVLSRAWCFQERILATRIAHFSRSELVFECKKGAWCECGFLAGGNRFCYKSEHHAFVHHRRDFPIEDLWKDLTRVYTSLDLTYKTDVLPALSGIAESMSQLHLGEYLAGLWTGPLLQSLMWRSVRVEECRRPTGVYLAPTFSWASRVGRVIYPCPTGRFMKLPEIYVTILDAKCVPASRANVYGAVSDGFLKLRGRLFPGILRFGPQFYQNMTLRREKSSDYIFFGAYLPEGFVSLWDYEDAGDPVVEIDSIDDLKGLTSRSEIYFLPIARWEESSMADEERRSSVFRRMRREEDGDRRGGTFSLVLKLCEDKKRFKRIGISLWGLYCIDFGCKKEEEIVII